MNPKDPPVKDDQENDEVETKFLEATITKADDGSFIAIASTNSVDRHGEIVDNNGWELKSFKKNPVILWSHDHTEPAIGVSKKTWVEGTGKKAKLMIQPLLHDVTERARAIKELVDLGIIRTLSVGFKPLESPDGVTFTKNELLEVSMVNVPANADAQMLAYKSLKSKGFQEDVIESVGIHQLTAELIDKVDGLTETVEELQKTVKAVPPVNPRKEVNERLSMLKVIARVSDKLLEGEKKNLPKADRRDLHKVAKRATEILIAEDLKRVR
jgi:HK97 family phage prohead protease